MKTLSYIITDELGIHARPAGQLVKVVAGFASKAELAAKGKTVDAKRIMGVMGLGAKKGDEITLTFSGPDEEEALAATQDFLQNNL